MELKDYTTEELREELKRRAKEARQNAVREKPKYIEIECKITNVHSCSYSKSFMQTEYSIETNDDRINSYDINRRYKLKNGCFTKNNVPKIGDTVIIGHLLTKARNTFSGFEAKIIRIVKRKEE